MIDKKKYFERNNLIYEKLEMTDISGSSTMKNKGTPLSSNKYFVIHHTAGETSAQGVVDILNSRSGLGIQWIIDKEGKLFKSLPDNSRGQHVSSKREIRKSGAPKDLSNDTSQGVEIVGSDDTKITLKQCKTTLLLIKQLGISQSNIYGHGEIQTNKANTEGATCKRYVLKYWDTPENELPIDDNEITTAQKNPDEIKTTSGSTTSSTGSTESNSNSQNTSTSNSSGGAISSFFDFFSPSKKNDSTTTTTTTNNNNDETSDKTKEENITEEVLRIQEIMKKII